MKLKILSDKYNKALERKDLEVEIEHAEGATPSRAAIQETVARHFSVKPENVEVQSIFTSAGMNLSKTNVKIWDKKTVEVHGKTEEPKAEEPEEAKAASEEAPAEETEETVEPQEEKPEEKASE